MRRMNRRLLVAAIATVAAAIFFAVDLSIPLGVAGGVPYVTVVLLCLWSPQRRDILLVAIICTALTLLGYFYSPPGGEWWKVVFNRALAIYAIWVVGMLGYLRRQSEDALRVSEAMIRKLAQFPKENPDPVLQVEKDGAILYANPAGRALLTHWDTQVGRALPADWRLRIETALGSGRAGEFEIEFQDRVFWLKLAPIVDHGYVYLYGHDITERRQVERQHQILLYEMGERIKEQTCMYAVAECIRERASLDKIFRRVAALIPPGWQYPAITRGKVRFDEHEYVSEPFGETQWRQSSDIVVNGECRGAIEVYYLEPCPELDEGPFMKEERNLIDGMASALSEAIERQQAEQAARTAQEELLEHQRTEMERVQAELEKAREHLVTQTRLASIGQVAGSIAHDLRNPLGAARIAIYYIKRYLPCSDPDLIEHLDIINEEISTADGIIGDLMNMARSKPLVREELDFGEVVRSAMHRAKLADGICCRVTLDPDPFILNADPGQLRQVVQNLLSNAVQALDGQGQITIQAKRGVDCSEIEIRDNGCGVAAEHRDRLFEPLFTTKAKGTGLGLTICREIIRRHGGSIELLDRAEPGASFRVRLPC